jgi:hypothetical protein
MTREFHETILDQRSLDVGQIVLDPEVQSRESVDQGTVEEYAEVWKQGATFPAVDVFFDGTVFRLADGSHRFLGAQLAGVTQIPAIVHPGSARDAFLFAAKCNGNHGRRRTNGDKRYLVSRFLQDPEWQTKSTRWIADACQVSHTFVQNLKAELATVASSDMVEGQDGKFRPARQLPATSHERLPTRLAGDGLERRQERCTLWWDQLAKYVILLSTAGWEPKSIADFLGMSLDEDVRPVLNPLPPVRDVADFKGISACPQARAKAYQEAVEHQILFALERVCGNAAFSAEDEGFPELRAELETRQQSHAKRLKELQFWASPLDVAETFKRQAVTLQICVAMDARMALGIEKNPDRIRQTKQPLSELFHDLMRQPDDGSRVDGDTAIS